MQERLAAHADTSPAVRPDGVAQPIDLFLATLRTAWKDGALRPTDRPIMNAKRGRRRPDPLVKATADLEIGSKPNHSGPAANYCHDCRPSIPAITRTNCFERFSTG